MKKRLLNFSVGASAKKTANALTVIALSLFFAACAAQHENPDLTKQAAVSNLWVSVHVSTNSLEIGEVVAANITVKAPLGSQVALPPLAPGWVLRDKQEVAKEVSGNWQEETWRYKLTSFSLGPALLASGAVQSISGNGGTSSSSSMLGQTASSSGTIASVEFPSPELVVVSCLTETNLAFQDIRELSFPSARSHIFWLVLLSLLVLGLALLAWYRRRAKREEASIVPSMTPQELALQALAALQERGLIEVGACEEFYVTLSAIARRYIEERFGLRAGEQTTEEFIREAMRSRELSSAQQDGLGRFLEQCDLVKFARHCPQAADMRQAYAAAERFVRETTPLPSEEPLS